MNQEAIVSDWVRRHAVPLDHLEPGHGFVDLERLRPMIGAARFVGLGECAHGVHEFFTLKHRLCEWLVEELGFTAIALESSYAGCQRINEYLLHGRGDPGVALTGQGYVAWDCTEFLDLLRWLRRHNQGLPDDRRVAFYGLDTGFNEVGRQAVVNFLERLAPDQLAMAQDAFGELADLESRWPMRIGDADQLTMARTHGHLEIVDNYLAAHQERLSAGSSPAELAQARRFLQVMLQWTEPGADYGRHHNYGRHHMGDNLIDIIENERPDLRAVVWQANAHVGRGFRFDDHPTLGDLMQERYGTAYCAIGLEFGQGSYLTRTATPDGYPADLVPTVMVEPPAGSLPWQLGQAEPDAFALDLRQCDDPVITSWLTNAQLEHGGMWIQIDPTTAYHDATIGRHYDGIIYIRQINPSHPTENARRTAAARTAL
jgi:erythromycin esterase